MSTSYDFTDEHLDLDGSTKHRSSLHANIRANNITIGITNSCGKEVKYCQFVLVGEKLETFVRAIKGTL